MTNPNDPTARPPLAAADPRISEWLDGRLTATEAAEVERAVCESPALSRLVADLRALKEAARLVPAVSPPPGFVDRVMAVVSAAGAADTTADRVVAREWHTIETERIAEEQAGAAADLAAETSPPPAASRRRAWPWLTIGAALAAGLLLALLLNRPAAGPREIARMTPEPERAQLEADNIHDRSPATASSPPLASPADVAAKPLAGEEGLGMEKMSQAKRAEMPAIAAPNLDAVEDRPLVVTVAAWTDFDRLLEAHGVEATPIGARAAPGRGGLAVESGSWTLELSGSAAGIDALLAAAGIEGRRNAAGVESKPAAAPPAKPLARQAAGQPPERTVLVRLVIREPGGQDPGPPQPAKPVSGQGNEP